MIETMRDRRIEVLLANVYPQICNVVCRMILNRIHSVEWKWVYEGYALSRSVYKSSFF